jgi:hypothetical protein
MKYKTIGAAFNLYDGNGASIRPYHYIVQEGDNPRTGDYLITSTNPHTGATKVAIVTETHEGFASPQATKTYVLCIPKNTIEVGLARRTEITGKVEASKAARAALQKMVQTVMAEQVFANLAETNPEARHLLAVMRGEANITPDETRLLQSMAAQPAPSAQAADTAPARARSRAKGPATITRQGLVYDDSDDSDE